MKWFKYSILIRKWKKLNWFVTLVDCILAFEGVDSTVSHFKKHNCVPDTEILILLRETNGYIRRAGHIRIF
jgi:Ran GTPase-activating protein (RanGAP) involved in mRNA processing and transport